MNKQNPDIYNMVHNLHVQLQSLTLRSLDHEVVTSKSTEATSKHI